MQTIALIFSILVSGFFGILSIFYASRDEKTKKERESQKKELSRRLYESTILKDIAQTSAYSLNIELVAGAIVASIQNLFKLTTASYAIATEIQITINTRASQGIGPQYLENISKIIRDSLCGIDETKKTIPIKVFPAQYNIENTISLPFDAVPLSYFNIPLIVNNRLRGLITISSHIPNIYQEEDMSMMYKIVNTAARSIGRLEEVIETEKGKTDSLIASLSSGAMLFMLEKNGLSISTINEAARIFLNLPAGYLETYMVLDRFGKTESILLHLQKVLTEKKTIVLNDIILSEKHFKLYISPVFYYDTKNVIGVSITMQDITMEKDLEALRENFTNMVVHQLRTPLTAIKGASNLLLNKNLNDKDYEKMLDVIKNSSEEGLNDIGSLLDAAKIDAGKFVLYKEMFDINSLVHQRAQEFLVLAGQKGITLNTNTQVGIPEFSFDPLRIGQVLSNLFSNSLKATPVGGTITIKTILNGGNLEVLVSDTGNGIPKDKIGLLFSKFGQIGNTANKDSTGLGLFISKGIVVEHGGKIWVESPVLSSQSEGEGKGTIVHFTLPIVKEKQVEEREALEIPQTFVN